MPISNDPQNLCLIAPCRCGNLDVLSFKIFSSLPFVRCDHTNVEVCFFYSDQTKQSRIDAMMRNDAHPARINSTAHRNGRHQDVIVDPFRFNQVCRTRTDASHRRPVCRLRGRIRSWYLCNPRARSSRKCVYLRSSTPPPYRPHPPSTAVFLFELTALRSKRRT